MQRPTLPSRNTTIDLHIATLGGREDASQPLATSQSLEDEPLPAANSGAGDSNSAVRMCP